MKQRMIWVAMLGLALASTSAAQTKISGTISCADANAKPDPAYSIDVGDSAGHSLGLLKLVCTSYANTVQIEGVAIKDSYEVDTTDTRGSRMRVNGYQMMNMANGDKVFARTSGTGTLTKDGIPVTVGGTWSFTGGTGKYKGLTGKGTYRVASGNAPMEIEGEYTLPGKK